MVFGGAVNLLGSQGWCKITEGKKYFGAKILDTLLENGKNMKKINFWSTRHPICALRHVFYVLIFFRFIVSTSNSALKTRP